MKPIVQLLMAMLYAGTVMGSTSQDSLPASSKAPLGTPILAALMDNNRAQQFASIVQAGGLTREDFGKTEVSFLVPLDATCTDDERARLKLMATKGAARNYIFSHAFRGQLNILPNAHGENAKLAYYFPDAGTLEPMRGRVTIDETHPFNLPLFDGGAVLVSLSDGKLHFGARSVLVYKENGAEDGDAFELDCCAVL